MIRAKKNKFNRREDIAGYLFLAPTLISILVFFAIPTVLSLYICFTNWNGYVPIGEAEWTGFKNFSDMLGGLYGEEFWQAVGNTVIMMIYVPIAVVLSLLLAVALNNGVPGSKVFRVLYYIPALANVVAITILFQKLFQNDGIINSMFNSLGIGSVEWLYEPNGSRAVVVILLIWKTVGYLTLLYIAGLQSVDAEVYEAAMLDGANSVTVFFKITLPLLRSITFFVVVTTLIGGFQIYTEPSILFPFLDGKGPEKSTQTIMVFFYYHFSKTDQLGLASCASWFLTILMFAVTGVQFYVNKRRQSS